MKNFFGGIIIFFVLFLLWKCAETTDPVLPTPVQTKRLLTGGSSKVWKLSEVLNYKGYNATCSDIIELKFFASRDSILINSNNQDCILSQDTLYGNYNISSDTAFVYLKFYRPKGVDTLRRKIIYITDKEFRAEYYSDSLKENLVARYLSL